MSIDDDPIAPLAPELAELVELRRTETGFSGASRYTDHGAIMGALQLLQQVIVAERWDGDKRLLSLQTSFANGGRSGDPVTFRVDQLQRGRSFSSLSITMLQGTLVISRALALLTADEPDYLRHQFPSAPTSESTAWVSNGAGLWPGSMQVATDCPPGTFRVRYQLSAAGVEPTLARGLVAMATEAPVMGEFVAMAGVPWQDGLRVAGNVMTHNIAFLEPLPLAEGIVVEGRARYAGRGRIHGDGTVADEAGQLLATFTTTGLLRERRKG